MEKALFKRLNIRHKRENLENSIKMRYFPQPLLKTRRFYEYYSHS